MRRSLVVIAIVILLTSPLPFHLASSSGGGYIEVFHGAISKGESLLLGNYTLTMLNAVYSGMEPVVLFRLVDNRNLTSTDFSLSPGQSYTYSDLKVKLIYFENSSSGPEAFLTLYSIPVSVFYGEIHANTTITHGGTVLSVLNVSDGRVFLRYYGNGTTDYSRMGPGTHFWHDMELMIYNVTDSKAYMKVLFPKYFTHLLLQGPVVILANISFSPVEVGAPFRLNVTLRNIGDDAAKYVKVYLYSSPVVRLQEAVRKFLLPTVVIPSFQSDLPFASYLQGPVGYTGELFPGHSVELSFSLVASKTLKPDVYPLYIHIEYAGEGGAIRRDEFQVGIPVNDFTRPEVSIDGFTTLPSPVEPGSNFTVVLRVKNTGNAPAYHVRVELLPTKPNEEQQAYSLLPSSQSSEQPSIYPVGRQSSLYFGNLSVNRSVEGRLFFAVKDVSAGVYPLYAVITYEDGNGVSYKEQTTFGVQVEGRPKLKAYIGNVWVSDGRYSFEVDVANDGKAPARGVTVSVSSPYLSLFPLGERYIGSVESMDYDSTNFMVLNRTIKAGRYPITVMITYLTINGSFKSLDQTVYLQIPNGISGGGENLYYYTGGALLLLLALIAWRLRRG